jgi:hypothetical protein
MNLDSRTECIILDVMTDNATTNYIDYTDDTDLYYSNAHKFIIP